VILLSDTLQVTMHDFYADDQGRYQTAGHMSENGQLASAHPPAYGSWNGDASPYSKWDPRGWSLKNKIFLAIGIIVVIVAIIVGSVLGVRANRYPNYSKLDYTLQNTFSGSSFFDNFEYFTGTDPANGFVQYEPCADIVSNPC
jgi:hypothetical protein